LGNTPSLDDVLVGSVLTGTLFAAGAPWPKDMPDAQSFIVSYRSVSNGAEPGPYAWSTYQAAQLLFDAMARCGRRPASARNWRRVLTRTGRCPTFP
jgi:ABC-type branched-subunit amino acid transport system substrate-binding protein